MSRRRKKNPDFFEVALGIISLLVLAGIHRGIGAAAQNFIVLALFLIVIVAGVAVCLITRSSVLARRVVTQIPPRPTQNQLPAAGQQNNLPNRSQSVTSISQQLRAIDWFQFEKLMTLAYAGAGVVERKGGANPDGGIDLVLNRQNERIGIQCKHWKSHSVGVRVVREMIGAMTVAGLKRGIIVSLNGYSKEATDLASRHSIELVNEEGIVALLRHVDQRQVQGILSDTKKFCPRCERQMVVRTARNGTRPGDRFWGCLGFPKCRYTLPFERGI